MPFFRSLIISSLSLTLPAGAFAATGSASSNALIEFTSATSGFSLLTPQMMEVRDAECVKNADGTYGTTSHFLKTLVLEKGNKVAIVPEYDYAGESVNPAQGDFPWKNCTKMTASMDTIDDILFEEGHFGALGWLITVQPLANFDDLVPLLRKEWNAGSCALARLRRGRYRNGVLTLTPVAKPAVNENDPCFPPRIMVKYSPALKKVAFWGYGYDDFPIDGSPKRMQQMLDSFRFR